jgi:16S rRNA (guanine527-N7)-methyltransferase
MALDSRGHDWDPLIARAAGLLGSELCAPHAAPSGAPTPPTDSLRNFLDQVVTWNRKVDLTAARSPEELVDLYLADALVIAANARHTSWVDIGTGGGAPGVVLALLRPELQLTLVEPRAKRTAFLRNSLALLGIDSAQVVRARSEELESDGFETAVSRATLPPPEWLVEGARLAREEVWVLLAQGEPPQHAGWISDCDLRYHWPLTNVARRAVRYVKAPSP